MVKNVLKSFNNLKKLAHNVKIVPVSINYERLFDASYLADEAKLGTFKPGTTFVSLMNTIMTMKQGHMGKVFIKYGEPIDLNQYVENHVSKYS
jgi:glycerol-3-phosphate O-acyltransferase